MKTRNGWVANSSSSSFVVAFDEMPKDEDELRQMMFGTKCLYGERGAYPTRKIANAVWCTMRTQAEKGDWGCGDGQIQFDWILDEMARGWIKDQPDWPDEFYREKDFEKRQEILERYDQLVREHNQVIRDAIFKPQDILFRFSYSDNDGDFWSFMEHGDIFRKLRHVHVSKH